MFDSLKKKLASFIGKTEEKALEKTESGVEEAVYKNEDESNVSEFAYESLPLQERLDSEEPVGVESSEPFENVVENDKPIQPEAEDTPVQSPQAPVEIPSKPSPEHKPRLSVKTKVKSFFSKTIRLSQDDLEELLEDLHISLMQSDVGVEASDFFIEEIKDRLVGVEVDSKKIHPHISNTLKEVLLESLTCGGEIDVIEAVKNSDDPYVILFLGVNGTGKTTTIAKFARLLKDNGLSSVLAAGDTFRAGAIEQLAIHADALGVKHISHEKGSDSAAVLYDAIDHAKARGLDVVLADSAGRMQTNVNLMDELKKIVRVNKPDLRIFVGDSLTGNDAVEQARKFDEMAGIDAIILTKMDADVKGGCALSITHAIGKPIIYVGLGQTYEDLVPFDPQWFVDQLI